MRVGLKINSHFMYKMSSYLRTFVDRLCDVFFERSLSIDKSTICLTYNHLLNQPLVSEIKPRFPAHNTYQPWLMA